MQCKLIGADLQPSQQSSSPSRKCCDMVPGRHQNKLKTAPESGGVPCPCCAACGRLRQAELLLAGFKGGPSFKLCGRQRLDSIIYPPGTSAMESARLAARVQSRSRSRDRHYFKPSSWAGACTPAACNSGAAFSGLMPAKQRVEVQRAEGLALFRLG